MLAQLLHRPVHRCFLLGATICVSEKTLTLTMYNKLITFLFFIHYFQSLFWGLADPSDFEQTLLLRCKLYKQA